MKKLTTLLLLISLLFVTVACVETPQKKIVEEPTEVESMTTLLGIAQLLGSEAISLKEVNFSSASNKYIDTFKVSNENGMDDEGLYTSCINFSAGKLSWTKSNGKTSEVTFKAVAEDEKCRDTDKLKSVAEPNFEVTFTVSVDKDGNFNDIESVDSCVYNDDNISLTEFNNYFDYKNFTKGIDSLWSTKESFCNVKADLTINGKEVCYETNNSGKTTLSIESIGRISKNLNETLNSYYGYSTESPEYEQMLSCASAALGINTRLKNTYWYKQEEVEALNALVDAVEEELGIEIKTETRNFEDFAYEYSTDGEMLYSEAVAEFLKIFSEAHNDESKAIGSQSIVALVNYLIPKENIVYDLDKVRIINLARALTAFCNQYYEEYKKYPTPSIEYEDGAGTYEHLILELIYENFEPLQMLGGGDYSWKIVGIELKDAAVSGQITKTYEGGITETIDLNIENSGTVLFSQENAITLDSIGSYFRQSEFAVNGSLNFIKFNRKTKDNYGFTAEKNMVCKAEFEPVSYTINSLKKSANTYLSMKDFDSFCKAMSLKSLEVSFDGLNAKDTHSSISLNEHTLFDIKRILKFLDPRLYSKE